MNHLGLTSKVIDITYDVNEVSGYLQTIDRICDEASTAIEDDFSFIILSDRNTSRTRVPLSALIACGAVHHHLTKREQRTQIGIIIESEVGVYCVSTIAGK